MKDKQPKITTTKVCDVHTTQPNVIAFSYETPYWVITEEIAKGYAPNPPFVNAIEMAPAINATKIDSIGKKKVSFKLNFATYNIKK